MDNILKLILMGAGIILTCLVVGMGFMLGKESSSISSASASKLSEFAVELSEQDLMQYDGLTVKGSDIINLIKKELGNYAEGEEAPIYVKVKTTSSENQYNNGNFIESCRDFSNSRYIKPIANFVGKIIKDKNDVIIGLQFVQK